MKPNTSRRQFAKALASSPVLAGLGAAATGAVAGAAGSSSNIKISFPGGSLEDSTLSFMQRLGVEWVNASGPNAPTYSPEGRVILRDGSTDTARGPWNETEIRAMKQKCDSFGLHLGILMLHDFRDVILGRARRDEQIEHVQESIRVAGRVGIPVVEYNFYALRAMGGYYRKPGRGRRSALGP